jgi:hypothetical protein
MMVLGTLKVPQPWTLRQPAEPLRLALQVATCAIVPKKDLTIGIAVCNGNAGVASHPVNRLNDMPALATA